MPLAGKTKTCEGRGPFAHPFLLVSREAPSNPRSRVTVDRRCAAKTNEWGSGASRPRRVQGSALAFLLLALFFALPAAADEPKPMHGIAMHGAPAYPADFRHFPYVNPDAPKGGTLRLHAIGGFDTLNAYTLKGMAASGLWLINDTLTLPGMDEAFTEYGLVAKTVTVPEDRSWVRFALRPEAKWHDGKPITPEDVIFTFETLRDKGDPFYRSYYAGVAKVEKTGADAVTFTFREAGNRELPLIIGQMPVLPKHYWQGRDFAATTLEPPLGSGPYKIAASEPGRSIVYARVKDYWGRDLPVNRGRNNPATVRFD
jgi:microcin C transport system substrate-binding protein